MLRAVDWSDESCPLCGCRIYRQWIEKFQDGSQIEHCTCEECLADMSVEKDTNGATESIYIE